MIFVEGNKHSDLGFGKRRIVSFDIRYGTAQLEFFENLLSGHARALDQRGTALLAGIFSTRSQPCQSMIFALNAITLSRIHIRAETYLRSLQYLSTVQHSAVFAVEVGKRKGMHLLGGPEMTVPIEARKSIAGVGGKVSLETQIAGHTNSGFDGIVGDHAAHNKSAVARRAQGGFERRADEGAIGLLSDHGFTRSRRGERVELVAGLARAVRGFRLERIVPDMINGQTALPPKREKDRYALLGLRVVAIAVFAPGRMVDGVLQVNEQQCGRQSELCQRDPVRRPGRAISRCLRARAPVPCGIDALVFRWRKCRAPGARQSPR